MGGVNTDDANRGVPFRAFPMDTACLFWEWGPRTDKPENLDVPLSDCFSLTTWAVANDRNTHIGVRPGDIPAFGRIYGYVATMGPIPSENATAGFRIEVVFKMPFLYR